MWREKPRTHITYILGEKQHVSDYDYSSEHVSLISYVALNCKTLECFAGLMRKYCSQRCGPIFTEICKHLLESYDKGDSITINGTKKDKLMALLTNKIATETGIKPIYHDMKCCLPPLEERINSLRYFIQKNKSDKICLQNQGKLIVNWRSTSRMGYSGRQRKHCYVLCHNGTDHNNS